MDSIILVNNGNKYPACLGLDCSALIWRKIIFTIMKSAYEHESWRYIIIPITKLIIIMENKYKEGDVVFSKMDPTLKLVIRRYVKRIYYCKIQEDPGRKELVYFERELMAVPTLWKNVHWLPARLFYNFVRDRPDTDRDIGPYRCQRCKASRRGY